MISNENNIFITILLIIWLRLLGVIGKGGLFSKECEICTTWMVLSFYCFLPWIYFVCYMFLPMTFFWKDDGSAMMVMYILFSYACVGSTVIEQPAKRSEQPPQKVVANQDAQKEPTIKEQVKKQRIEEGVIGKGRIYESPWYIYQGPVKGPSIIVEAGIHGDEVAGTHAIDALLPEIEIIKGRVIWFPRMNKPAFDKNKRFINVDLNKVFPGDAKKKDYEHSLASEIFTWVGKQKADVVLTLHESRYLHDGSTARTFGQTIVYGVKPMPALLPKVLDQLNEKLIDKRHRFFPNYFPIATSSTEQFVDNFKMQGYCAETWRGFQLKTRIALQRELILAFLDQLGVTYTWKKNKRIENSKPQK